MRLFIHQVKISLLLAVCYLPLTNEAVGQSLYTEEMWLNYCNSEHIPDEKVSAYFHILYFQISQALQATLRNEPLQTQKQALLTAVNNISDPIDKKWGIKKNSNAKCVSPIT